MLTCAAYSTRVFSTSKGMQLCRDHSCFGPTSLFSAGQIICLSNICVGLWCVIEILQATFGLLHVTPRKNFMKPV